MQRQASAALGAALQAAGPLACVLRERASFELSYEDESVELLRKKVDTALVLRACHAGQLAEAEAAQAQEEAELRAWKARRPPGRSQTRSCTGMLAARRRAAAARLRRGRAGAGCARRLRGRRRECVWGGAGRGGRAARAPGAPGCPPRPRGPRRRSTRACWRSLTRSWRRRGGGAWPCSWTMTAR